MCELCYVVLVLWCSGESCAVLSHCDLELLGLWKVVTYCDNITKSMTNCHPLADFWGFADAATVTNGISHPCCQPILRPPPLSHVDHHHGNNHQILSATTTTVPHHHHTTNSTTRTTTMNGNDSHPHHLSKLMPLLCYPHVNSHTTQQVNFDGSATPVAAC